MPLSRIPLTKKISTGIFSELQRFKKASCSDLALDLVLDLVFSMSYRRFGWSFPLPGPKLGKSWLGMGNYYILFY